MTELAAITLTSGRPLKFTPERIQQIKNLLEKGKSRQEIADIIGVTLGSLQVTCSKLGISLRRPVFNNGAGLLQRTAGNGSSKGKPMTQPEIVSSKDAPDQPPISFASVLRYKGHEVATTLPLTPDMIRQLMLEAAIRDMRISDLIGELLMTAMKEESLAPIVPSSDA
jgi:hypothetical protein